ncbi:MAG: dienelactone hydrolase family protein [Solirubrobacterales bacterium]|nr:dienelactone hydrolase family protein [Solirubrobacterales bacterium]
MGDEIRGYLALPEAGGRSPALVMAHENLGVTEHRQDVTRRFAAAGFATLTVDLFSRAGGPPTDFSSPEERRVKAFLQATDDQAVPDILAGLRYLRRIDAVDGSRAGTIGFCMGGGTSLVAACLGDAFKACVILYALPVLPGAYTEAGRELSRIAIAPALRCPLQGHFGEEDQVIPLRQVSALQTAAQQSGQPVEFHTYPGANHAYHDDTHPNYHADAAALSWDRAVASLRDHL